MTPPRTARQVLAALAPYHPAVAPDGLGLEYDDPPAALDRAATLLKTGVMAALSGRSWYGCHGSTGRTEALSLDGPIPRGVTLLTVEGAAKWDRIPSAARLDHPELFAAVPPAATRHAGRVPVRKPVLV